MTSNNFIDELKKRGVDAPDNKNINNVMPPAKRRRRRLYESFDSEQGQEQMPEQEQENHQSFNDKKPTLDESINVSSLSPKTEIKKIKVKKQVSKRKPSYSKEDLRAAEKDAISKPKGNFTSIPNEVIEKTLMGNFSLIDIRFILLIARKTLGWQQKIAYMSRSEISTEGNVNPNSIDRSKKTLLKNGVIGIVKGSASEKSGYYLRSSFFNLAKEESETLNNEIPDSLKSRVMSLEGGKVQKDEFASLQRLIAEKKKEDELLLLFDDLKANGDLKGAEVSKPFSYLESGAYQAVLNRASGKNQTGINPQVIFEAISQHDLRSPLPEEIKLRMSSKDEEWIESRGGRAALNQMSEFQLKKELGLAVHS